MGYDEAFGTIHDRYRQRLFAYTRQMLGGSRSDAEDVLQDVFLRAYGALRNDDRPVTLRAWLYRVAHNRCIDHLRRPVPPAAEIYELSRTPAQDPQAETVRREDLRRLVQDVQRLPEQQRSALLMRELDGLTYAELADALDTSVPAIKSLLVRARIGLVEAGEARDAACVDIRADLVRAHGRGVRASGRSRRHLRDCDGCREYRRALRGVDEGIAALVPGGAGPLATVAKLLGIGGASSGAAAGAGAGGTAAVAGGATAATATATKVVAIVCCAAVVGGGAAEVREHVTPPAPASHSDHHVRKAAPRAAAAAAAVAPVKAPVARAVDPVRDAGRPSPTARNAHEREKVAATPAVTSEPGTGSVAAPASPSAPVAGAAPEEAQTGGAMAPDEDAMPDASGTGAVGAPSPTDPTAATPAAPVATITPSAGSNGGAGTPAEQGGPMAGPAPAAPAAG
jgi:RNA polymerase sigma factor (sigma-70 family)